MGARRVPQRRSPRRSRRGRGADANRLDERLLPAPRAVRADPLWRADFRGRSRRPARAAPVASSSTIETRAPPARRRRCGAARISRRTAVDGEAAGHLQAGDERLPFSTRLRLGDQAHDLVLGLPPLEERIVGNGRVTRLSPPRQKSSASSMSTLTTFAFPANSPETSLPIGRSSYRAVHVLP